MGCSTTLKEFEESVLKRLFVLLILGGLLFCVKPSQVESNSLSVSELQAFEESVRLEREARERIIYQEYLYKKAQSLVGKRGGTCVIFVKSFFGVKDSWGWARNVKVNSKTPQVGSVMVTNQSKWGHIQIVLTPVDEHNGIWIVDSNYNFDGKVRIRYVILNKTPVIGYRIL